VIRLLALGVALIGVLGLSGCSNEVTTQDVEKWQQAEGAPPDPEPEPR
jgi:hypothetical protein